MVNDANDHFGADCNRDTNPANHPSNSDTRAYAQAESNGYSHTEPYAIAIANCNPRTDSNSHTDTCANRIARAYGDAHGNPKADSYASSCECGGN